MFGRAAAIFVSFRNGRISNSSYSGVFATLGLTYVENEPTQGTTPRNFGIDPTGKYVLAANQRTGNVVVFSIDDKTGELSPTGQHIQVPSPVCVKFLHRS